MADKFWYCLSVQTRKEQAAAEIVAQFAREVGASVETFCPRIETRQKTVYADRIVTGPLFPGYVFTWCDLADIWHGLKRTWLVRRVVGTGAGPAMIEPMVIEEIKSRLTDGVIRYLPTRHVFELESLPGEQARMKTGPWAGYVMKILNPEVSKQRRVSLLLEAIESGAFNPPHVRVDEYAAKIEGVAHSRPRV